MRLPALYRTRSRYLEHPDGRLAATLCVEYSMPGAVMFRTTIEAARSCVLPWRPLLIPGHRWYQTSLCTHGMYSRRAVLFPRLACICHQLPNHPLQSLLRRCDTLEPPSVYSKRGLVAEETPDHHHAELASQLMTFKRGDTPT